MDRHEHRQKLVLSLKKPRNLGEREHNKDVPETLAKSPLSRTEQDSSVFEREIHIPTVRIRSSNGGDCKSEKMVYGSTSEKHGYDPNSSVNQNPELPLCAPRDWDREAFIKSRSKFSKRPIQIISHSKVYTAPNPAEENLTANKSETQVQNVGKSRDSYTSASRFRISYIVFGEWEIKTWYMAPFPDEYCKQDHIFICHWCFKYMRTMFTWTRHCQKCPLTYPPGNEIYRIDDISIFEVEGRKNKIYCQNLCIMAKLFIDNKTLYYDVEPFLFYIAVIRDSLGVHFCGYFSKEKNLSSNCNLSCILVLPIYQKRGIGGLLIDLSYLLSKRQKRVGSPEKPLSPLGLISYNKYWIRKFLEYIVAKKSKLVTLYEISIETAISPRDIFDALKYYNMLQKNHKGENIILLPKEQKIKEIISKKTLEATRDRLKWVPFMHIVHNNEETGPFIPSQNLEKLSEGADVAVTELIAVVRPADEQLEHKSQVNLD